MVMLFVVVVMLFVCLCLPLLYTVWAIPLALGLGNQTNTLEVKPLNLTLREGKGERGGREEGERE